MSVATDFELLGSPGLVCASVCTSLSVRDATLRLNREVPTGIASRWAKSRDKTFATGETNPHACTEHPGHRHLLFNC
jgi:hypothetical protein